MSAGLSSQYNHGVPWIGNRIRMRRDPDRSNAKELGNPFTVGEEPGLDRPHRHAETHHRGRLTQPSVPQGWRALRLAVQVHEDDPRRKAGCVVVTRNSLPEVVFSVLAVDTTNL
jgi:hypothetical protein